MSITFMCYVSEKNLKRNSLFSSNVKEGKQPVTVFTYFEWVTANSPVMANRYVRISEKFQTEQVELLNGLCDFESSKKVVRNEGKPKKDQEEFQNVSGWND